MKILHEAIQIYDKLCGKNYLIVFGSKDKYKFVEIVIKQSSFWHLLGCNLESDTNEGKNSTYLKCKNKENVSDKISSVHSFSEIESKYEAMKNVFDFIDKAKQLKIGYATDCPEQYLFKIGAGNNTGIIGYDYSNKGYSNILFPKSAQLKSLSKISKSPHKIFIILSKNIGEKYYKNLEYEISSNVHSEIQEYLPDEINISLD